MMGLEQYKATVNKKKEIDLLTGEQRLLSEDLEKESQAIKVMLVSPGWKALKNYFKNAIRIKREQLDFISLHSDEAAEVQAEVRAIKNVLSFVETRSD